MKEELLKGLTEEQIAKIKACKSQEEVLKLAKEEGVELTDEQLAAVSGGACTTERCPRCDSDRVTSWSVKYFVENHVLDSIRTYKKCDSCQYEWDEQWTYY